MRKTVCMLVAGLAAVVVAATPAAAHKVVASTYVAGDAIEGEIGFSDGAMAVDTPVMVTAPDGRVLGETRTDGDGFFTFTPTEAVDHVFRADLGAGHVAEVVMPAAELPKAVAAGGGASGPATTAVAAVAAATAVAGRPAAESAPAGLTPDLRDAIAVAVRDEVRPLRREIAAYKEKNDLQTILGGLGYIAGLCGVAFYLIARQRLKRAAA